MLGVEGLEPQRGAGWLEPEAKARSKVLATAAQRVAIAVQVALADAAEVEAIQAGLHQSVLACPPAARLGLDLFQHQQSSQFQINHLISNKSCHLVWCIKSLRLQQMEQMELMD